MNVCVYVLLFVLVGCGDHRAAMVPVADVIPEPAAIVVPRVRHPAAPPAAEAGPAAPASPASVAAVIRDSNSLIDKTYRYVEFKDARADNVRTLIQLKHAVDRANDAVINHHHPTTEEVAAARHAADDLAHFFATKDDD